MEEESPPPPPKPSQVPSWVTLGFALGALFVIALPRRAPVAQEVLPVVEPAPAKPEAPRPISTIEAVFAAWDKYAVWSDDTTEVALWDTEKKSFSECYEVLRVGDGYYFRSILHLTRPILTHGVVDGSPLQFTETARQRDEWLADVSKENLRALSEGAHDALAPLPDTPAKK